MREKPDEDLCYHIEHRKTASLLTTRELCHALPHTVRLQLEEVLVHVAWSGLGLVDLTLGGPLGLLILTLTLTPSP